MTYAGIAMVALGAVGLVTGAVVGVEGSRRTQIYGKGGYLRERRSEDGMQNGGIALAVIGGVAAAAGFVVWVYGAHKVPIVRPATEPSVPARAPSVAGASLRLGVGTATLHVDF